MSTASLWEIGMVEMLCQRPLFSEFSAGRKQRSQGSVDQIILQPGCNPMNSNGGCIRCLIRSDRSVYRCLASCCEIRLRCLIAPNLFFGGGAHHMVGTGHFGGPHELPLMRASWSLSCFSKYWGQWPPQRLICFFVRDLVLCAMPDEDAGCSSALPTFLWFLPCQPQSQPKLRVDASFVCPFASPGLKFRLLLRSLQLLPSSPRRALHWHPSQALQELWLIQPPGAAAHTCGRFAARAPQPKLASGSLTEDGGKPKLKQGSITFQKASLEGCLLFIRMNYNAQVAIKRVPKQHPIY